MSFGSTPAAGFSVVDDSTVTAVTPPGTGTIDVTVTTTGGTSPITLLDRFTFIIPPPVVSSVSPASGLPGTLVTVHGSSLTGATQICFGGSCVPGPTVVDDSTVTVAVPLSPLEGSTVHVTVTTPGGTSASSSGDLFTLL